MIENLQFLRAFASINVVYLHVLTPKGISTKTNLTYNFMKKKFREYEELKKEINK